MSRSRCRRAERRSCGSTTTDAPSPAATGSPAIVPGKLDESELYRRITPTDPDERMPPAKTRQDAHAAEIERLKTWIEQGAEYWEHWAFVAPQRPAAAGGEESRLGSQPDRLLHSGPARDRRASTPSPEADKVTLAPPAEPRPDRPAADDRRGRRLPRRTRAEAYEKQVERLLASPHYGERWGRIWLDAARYADSDGYEKDKPRQVWFYRDWVINALNRDLPYDQFIIEQIAGDLLPDATQDQVVATGFLRNSMINEEGGIDPEQFRMEAMFDRMDAIGKGILGLTIQCAQCHNHKYDPLTQEEYYRMFAFLNNDHEANDRGLHARRADAARRHLPRRSREIEARSAAPQSRLAGADGRLGRAGPRRSAGVDRRAARGRSTSRPAAQKYLPHDGRLVAGPGLRADQAHASR